MELFNTIALLVAFIMFLLAAFNVSASRINLVAFGLAAWVLVPLVAAIETLR